MLELFRVSFKGKDHFFENKMEAKRFGFTHGLKGSIIHRGPDHRLGPSDGKSTRTPSSKRLKRK